MKIKTIVNEIRYNLINQYRIKKYGIKTGKNLCINGICKFISDNKGSITIGENVTINSGESFNQIGGDTRSVLRTIENGTIYIGNKVGISNSSLIARNCIIIEDSVMIGGSCSIYDNDFHSVKYEERMEKPDTHIASAPVCIKKGAFIGAHSIILKGVTIGEKAIVGAGSVVTKSISDGEIWAGNPAKFIRKI